MSDTHVTDLLAAYAVGCLDEKEYLLVSRHLSACEACQAELKRYQDVADNLPLATRQVEPPARIKVALMNRVQADLRQEEESVKTRDRGENWLQRLENLLRGFSPAWSLVSLALILILATSNILLWGQVRSMQDASESQALRTINLSGTDFAPDAKGLIVVSLDGEHGTLVVDRLPVLEEGKDYQLWLIEDGERTDGGVFSVSRDGYGSVWVSSPKPLADYSAFGITIEPEGGSPGPTGEKVLGGEL